MDAFLSALATELPAIPRLFRVFINPGAGKGKQHKSRERRKHWVVVLTAQKKMFIATSVA